MDDPAIKTVDVGPSASLDPDPTPEENREQDPSRHPDSPGGRVSEPAVSVRAMPRYWSPHGDEDAPRRQHFDGLPGPAAPPPPARPHILPPAVALRPPARPEVDPLPSAASQPPVPDNRAIRDETTPNSTAPSPPRSPRKARPAKSDSPEEQRYSSTMKEIPLSDRPRERLEMLGPQALTTAELVAILIQSGNEQRSAVSLAEHLLARFGGLHQVAAASVEQLMSVKGIGLAKATQVKAGMEFGRRIALLAAEERILIGGPRDVANLLMSELRYLKKETMKSVLLDSKNRVIAVRTVSIGDLTSSIVHPREVFKDAVVASAAAIIVAHNHPSGDPSPSPDDINTTKRLLASGEMLGIDLLDHIIIGDGVFVSLKERNLF